MWYKKEPQVTVMSDKSEVLKDKKGEMQSKVLIINKENTQNCAALHIVSFPP